MLEENITDLLLILGVTLALPVSTGTDTTLSTSPAPANRQKIKLLSFFSKISLLYRYQYA